METLDSFLAMLLDLSSYATALPTYVHTCMHEHMHV